MKSQLQSSGLRKMLALQMQLLKEDSSEETGIVPTSAQNLNTKKLLTAAFNQEGFSVVGAAGSIGRGVLNAGDRLREMIIPESLANLAGGWSNSSARDKTRLSKKEILLHSQLQEELDEIIAASCPLCDSLVNNLEKEYINSPGDAEGWRL
jgi:vacuolar protein sorting-associated protein 18